MKVNFDLESSKKGVSFSGYKAVKDDTGFKSFEFAHPFDPEKEDCYLEIYKLAQDKYDNYYSTGKAYSRDGRDRIKLAQGSNRIDLADKFGIDDNSPFAYHFVIVNKNNGMSDIRIDVGDSIDERNSRGDKSLIFNIVSPSKSNLSRGGSMKLVIIDSQKVGYVYNDKNLIVKDEKLAKRGKDGIKTITNKFGGTLAGLEKAVSSGEFDSYGRIISLPVFTDDDFTAHAYWNKNCMQTAISLGNINNYSSLQRKMFAHGLNFVSDGAFVNEGLQGVHFKSLLKWGEDSPYLHWFRASGIKDNPLALGVFGKYTRHVSHKIVNSPYNYSQDSNGKISITDNESYNPKRPTYIQFFDDRLVSKEERRDNKHLIKTYSKMSTDSVYDLHTHNDSVFPYAFEINPEVYNKNIERLNEYNSVAKRPIKMESAQGSRLLSKFPTFDVEEKFESGFETWDANPDIAKLNFVFSNTDNKDLKNLSASERRIEIAKIQRGNWQVQDYVVESGKYWTRKTDDILRLHIAQHLKNVSAENPSKVYSDIMRLSNGKVLPKTVKTEVSKAEVENILNDLYNNKRNLPDYNKQEQILSGIMNTPLDAIEFGDNVVSVFASPLISKRASVEDEIGVSRFDLYKQGNVNLPKEYKKTYDKMDDLFKTEIYSYASDVLNKVNDQLNSKLFEGNDVTEYGKYVLPMVLEQITKYAIVKSLAPNIAVNVDPKTGEIYYDYKKLKNTHLQTLGINNASSPEEEALMLISKINSGMKTLDNSNESEIVQSVIQTLKGTDANSFKLADLIIDKTQSGLDWRIDATKDIADVESLRNSLSSFDQTWKSIISFWKKFNQGVIGQNPNAYLVAEITDENTLYDGGWGYRSGKFSSKNDIIPKFLRETGMTSLANYSYYFSDIPKLFTKSFEDAGTFDSDEYKQKMLHDKLIGANGAFLKSSSLDSLMYSYTFIGNHDKPRAIHCAAMDMGMFYADLNYPEDYKHREMAYRLVNDKILGDIDPNDVNHFDYSAISPKAIAMGYALHRAFVNVLNDYKWDNKLSQEEFDQALIAISRSLADLSRGKFLEKHFDPDAFGIKPFDISIEMVLKHAKRKHGLNLPNDLDKHYSDDVFKKAIDPAISKVLGMMKYLVALPGMPTLFDGDDAGATGYDSKTKNMYLQGRQRIHDEWLDDKDSKFKKFIADHKKEFDEVMSIRTRPELNALNNGAVYMMPLQSAKEDNGKEIQCPTILRQSTDGRMAISVLNTSGLHYDYENYYSPQHLKIDAIRLNAGKDNNGNDVRMDGAYGVGLTGLKPGTVFINANDENDKYYVNEFNGEYFLKRGTGDGTIDINDSTLILYHVPSKTPLTFTGSNRIKPSYKFIAKTYSQV
ncbi:hypothetical protein IJ579_08370 [bacterium]|nr:hypothetical protein [bacterium]